LYQQTRARGSSKWEGQMAMQFRLTTELVPRGSWYDNMRSVLPKTEWDKLRKSVYAEYDHRCGICGAEARLNCHEIWEYDDQQHIQTLRGFIALCDWCHHVKHLGLAGILADEGKLDYEKVVQHFMIVNGCDRTAFEDYKHQVFAQWRARSQHKWTVNLGQYGVLVEHKPRKP
jgi:hypothetical protein